VRQSTKKAKKETLARGTSTGRWRHRLRALSVEADKGNTLEQAA